MATASGLWVQDLNPSQPDQLAETTSRAPENGVAEEHLRWIRQALSLNGTAVHVTLRDFKNAARDRKFAEHLFKLFDVNGDSSVSLPELIGGLGKLTPSPTKKIRRTLDWFEDEFSHLADEEHLLRVNEFHSALQIRKFTENFFTLLSSNNGRVTLDDLMRALNRLTCSSDLDSNLFVWYEQQFAEAAGGDGMIDLKEFETTLFARPRQRTTQAFEYFAQRLFKYFDRNKDGQISLRELIEGLTTLTKKTPTAKLDFLFQIYDENGDGKIVCEELRRVLEFSVEECNLSFPEHKIDTLTRTLFDDIDTDHDGCITFAEFHRVIQENYPELVNSLTIRTYVVYWLKPETRSRSRKNSFKDFLPTWLTRHYIRNNLTWIVWLLMYLLANIVLFMAGAIYYRNAGPSTAISRGCGLCLNFNPTWVMILMMRKLQTWLRSTRIAFLLPLDQSIEFHKLTGWCIFVLSCVHAAAHFVNFSILSLKVDGLPYWRYYLTANTGVGWVAGTAGLTGVLLLIILMVIVTVSLMRSIPLRGSFEVFYWTHHLFVIWYILLILHAPHFWKWFIVPGLLYLVEWALRLRWVQWALYGSSQFTLSKVKLLSSEVTHLDITRPSNFSYHPGEYVFINIPAIAWYEWHPFTISSAPEKQEFFSLHIKNLGNWTKALYYYFKHDQDKKRHKWHRGSDDDVVEDYSDDPENYKVYIDGPYGAPAVHIFQVEYAVLIASNIGVTPFASILQSIMLRRQDAFTICSECDGNRPICNMKLKKVDFFWVYRDQRSFEWFLDLMTQLEIDQSKQCKCDASYNFLDMNIYMTSLNKIDVKSIGLQMALKLISTRVKEDVITGLKTRTRQGRPDLEEVFRELEQTSKIIDSRNIDVFFCGAPEFAKAVKAQCAKDGKFKFHEENF